VLTTGNKSELSVGYCTLYGDMCGALAPIADLFKTRVWSLARWINRDGVRIPVASIEKPPSAELRPNQTDQDSLPPYDLLDAILARYVERAVSVDAILAEGFDPAVVRRVARLVDISEFKRRQAAPAIRISDKAFGVGRRYPIAALGPSGI
jgi:NAD+ synthetase